ncbi:protein phosphatase CheZ [Microvirga lenta]|uniref:protein phosphatase CheZ n=1 Tax=Microvirga lenta TaxID=2881337 RepID=UPI001CFFFDEB|nr:protein phosphatase CheZ [Microvirga lenta]MCB5177714.1 protein phosphatase CheZ [Microvirga lenta]
MEAITSLRQHVQPTFEASQILLEERQHELLEVQRLKIELHAISEAIQRTKQEIATLHYAGAQGREMARVTDELGAVVLGTETATNSILAAAEEVDDLAANLAARLTGEEGDMARQIGERTVSIFEACNFQDITGQRISKVVSAMRFVEDRVEQMIQIWGGHERFKNVPTTKDPSREGDKALLNGPALAADGNGRSQDDIDAYFR